MNDLFSQQQPELYPEIVKYVPPVLTEEEIKFFKKHVQKMPLATRERRKNSFTHKPIEIHLTEEQLNERVLAAIQRRKQAPVTQGEPVSLLDRMREITRRGGAAPSGK